MNARSHDAAGPFRKACDGCTKAKSKCNGLSPCSLCSNRGTECIYSFKRRRGLKRSAEVGKQVDQHSKQINLSPYERRLWSCFFTIFKNQNGDEKKGLAWCWFARQLATLRKLCDRSNNTPLCNSLDSFMESMNINEKQVEASLDSCCPFSSAACAHCAAIAINGDPLVICPMSQNSVLHERKSTPNIPFTDLILGHLDSNVYPALTLVQDENTTAPASRVPTIKINEIFGSLFGLDEAGLKDLLKITAYGFLPWSGDILARMLVSELDLISFIQISSLKFAGLGLHDAAAVVRDIPSVHSFKFWAKDTQGNWEQSQFMMHFNLRFIKSSTEMLSEVSVMWMPIGAPYEIDSCHKFPISLSRTQAEETPTKELKTGEKSDWEMPFQDDDLFIPNETDNVDDVEWVDYLLDWSQI